VKYLLFSDLHIGEHLSYDKTVNNIPESFYDIENIINQITEIVDKEHISLIIFLGDLFHNVSRLSVPIVVYTTLLFKRLSTHAPIIMLTGNHDQIYPSKLHQLTSVFIDTKNIKVVNTISQHYFYSNNINMIFLSFMKNKLLEQNMNLIFKDIIKPKAKNILFGHFTLSKERDNYLSQFG